MTTSRRSSACPTKRDRPSATRGILYDRDPDGEYFQLYTPTLFDRFFFEIVERRSYSGFGAPNAPIRLAAQTRLAKRMSSAPASTIVGTLGDLVQPREVVSCTWMACRTAPGSSAAAGRASPSPPRTASARPLARGEEQFLSEGPQRHVAHHRRHAHLLEPCRATGRTSASRTVPARRRCSTASASADRRHGRAHIPARSCRPWIRPRDGTFLDAENGRPAPWRRPPSCAVV